MPEYKEINDFKIVAALLAKGYTYTDVFKQGSRVSFTFEWDAALQELEDDYFNNKLDVDAQTYGKTLGDIKKMIYSQELR